MATPARFAFARPEWLGEVDSTNTFLKVRAAAGSARPGDVVAARRQTAGRGRMGNRWLSAADGDIAFSFYWKGNVDMLAAGMLPMACALGVADFLRRPPWGIPALCKWPNDVLADDAKICGILAEGGREADGGIGLVVGIGVNVKSVPGRDDATSRRTAAVSQFVREPDGVGPPDLLLPPLLECLALRIGEWEEGGAGAVVRALRPRLWGIGKRVRARCPDGVVEGVVEGVGESGELLLRTDAGLTGLSSVNALENGWE